MVVISSWICLCPIYWSRMLSREWRCSWSSADRRCFNYIWVINNLVAYKGASYIRDLTVLLIFSQATLLRSSKIILLKLLLHLQGTNELRNNFKWHLTMYNMNISWLSFKYIIQYYINQKTGFPSHFSPSSHRYRKYINGDINWIYI